VSDHSKIEWTSATWNIVTGCTRVSAGCDHCYIERTPPFRIAGRRFDGDGPGSTTGVVLHPDRLELPLRWRKPRRIFVNSLSDAFHKDVPAEFIALMFAVMAATPQHTYQLLTKRPGRMRSLVGRADFETRVRDMYATTLNIVNPRHLPFPSWPLPNAWLGVSVENQTAADLRIPLLLSTPAAVRFLSCEPLLGLVDLDRDWLFGEPIGRCTCGVPEDMAMYGHEDGCDFATRGERVDWVIAGGESGPGARPVHPDWLRSLRDQCSQAGVAYFLKQWGEWVPESMLLHKPTAAAAFLGEHGFRPLVNGKPIQPPMARGNDVTIRRVGRKTAGRLLDGRTHDEFPAAVAP